MLDGYHGIDVVTSGSCGGGVSVIRSKYGACWR